MEENNALKRKFNEEEPGGSENENNLMKTSFLNPSAKKMMIKMGYIIGQGIGKSDQGIIEPIEASKQRGTRGLGFKKTPTELPESNEQWDFEQEKPGECQVIKWCSNTSEDLELKKNWIIIGKKKTNLDNEVEFCDAELLKNVLDLKSILDNVENKDLIQARQKANPFEIIGSSIFLNRAAVKMANMDHDFELMFTSPKTPDELPLVQKNELLTFADICAGPGGFSEYVLWKVKGQGKGFGMTLKGDCDFRLDKFFVGPSEMFETSYGEDDDGDIFKSKNQEFFKNLIFDQTRGEGVHVLMADGGFSVEGQENIQEILSHRLYLCQFLLALLTVRKDGNFVCKLFDIFSLFSAGLIYLTSQCFHKFCIFKPITSRPANSERYIIFKNKKNNCEQIIDYLKFINEKMEHLVTEEMVTEILPYQIISSNKVFFDYLVDSNNFIAKLQIQSLKKLKIYIQNKSLENDSRQLNLAEVYLRKWQIPDNVAKYEKKNDANEYFASLQTGNNFFYNIEKLTLKNLKDKIKTKHDVVVCVLSNNTRRGILMSQGKNKVFFRNLQNGRFENLSASEGWSKFYINLPKKTILDVEILEEFSGQDKNKKRNKVIHALDLICWFGEFFTHLNFEERQEKLFLFLKYSSFKNIIEIHPKRFVSLAEVEVKIFNLLRADTVRGMGSDKKLLMPIHEENKTISKYQLAEKLLIIKTSKFPWMKALSKQRNIYYYFNHESRKSIFEKPLGFDADYDTCSSQSVYWIWDKLVKMHDEVGISDNIPNICSKENFLKHIKHLS